MKRPYRRILSAIILALGITAGLPSMAAAHILESDGGISAVLHIPPDDEPIAGQAAELDLAFAVRNGTFSLADYRTDVSVRQNGTVIQRGPLQRVEGSGDNATLTVTFPDPGAYNVSILGQPLKTAAGKGKAFNLSFNVRADRTGGGAVAGLKAAGADFWSISLGSLAVVCLTARYFILRDGRYRPENPNQPASVRKPH